MFLKYNIIEKPVIFAVIQYIGTEKWLFFKLRQDFDYSFSFCLSFCDNIPICYNYTNCNETPCLFCMHGLMKYKYL